MAYDHSGDLPEDYNFRVIKDRLVSFRDRMFLHERVERRNYLNQIGHPAVVLAVDRMRGPEDASFADLGAMFYEIATDPPFIDLDTQGTPTYRDPHNQLAALWAAYTLDCYNPLEMYEVAGTALAVMDEDAPGVSGLIEDATIEALGRNLTTDNIRSIKSGAALMRTLHMTAQYRLDGGNFSDL